MSNIYIFVLKKLKKIKFDSILITEIKAYLVIVFCQDYVDALLQYYYVIGSFALSVLGNK